LRAANTMHSLIFLALRFLNATKRSGVIEIAPLAYMRARTLDACIHQYLTRLRTLRPEQMKMFLTRLGFSSKAVVTGDYYPDRSSQQEVFQGLEDVRIVLAGVEGIQFVHR